MTQTDPRFASRIDRSFRQEMFPAWAQEAACAGHDTDDWGSDETADATEELSVEERDAFVMRRMPERALRSMKVCYGCPVRRVCLEDAFVQERREEIGIWWSGELVEEKRRFLIRGGIPGRIREHHAEDIDRLEVLAEWLEMVATLRRWTVPEATEAMA